VEEVGVEPAAGVEDLNADEPVVLPVQGEPSTLGGVPTWRVVRPWVSGWPVR
jgi:hypothetical protein